MFSVSFEFFYRKDVKSGESWRVDWRNGSQEEERFIIAFRPEFLIRLDMDFIKSKLSVDSGVLIQLVMRVVARFSEIFRFINKLPVIVLEFRAICLGRSPEEAASSQTNKKRNKFCA